MPPGTKKSPSLSLSLSLSHNYNAQFAFKLVYFWFDLEKCDSNVAQHIPFEIIALGFYVSGTVLLKLKLPPTVFL